MLRAFNDGSEETTTLTEWLAVDHPALLSSILTDVGLDDAKDEIVAFAESIAERGIVERLERTGSALYSEICNHPNRDEIYENLAMHRSDTVRDLAAYIIMATPGLSFKSRLDAVRRFADDPNYCVRECAWMVLRPYLPINLDANLLLFADWVVSENENIRRLAIEGTRPCGVWCKHIAELKYEPERALFLLEVVRADSSDYVRNAVANWLNDASKSRPEWVIEVCARWLRESDYDETKRTIKRATRTLRKKEYELPFKVK